MGLVGPNGAGKTTVFRMIVGEESPENGEVSVPKKLTVEYFRQDVEEMSDRSTLDEAIAGSGRAGNTERDEAEQRRPFDGSRAAEKALRSRGVTAQPGNLSRPQHRGALPAPAC